MKARTKTALGIDIGEHQVSVALVEKSDQDISVIAAAGSDVPSGDPTEWRSACATTLSGLLKQLGRRARTPGTKAAVAVPTNSTVMQLLDMPQNVPTNIGEFVNNELQQCVALSGRNVVSDFCGLGSGLRRRLFTVAADAAEVQEMVKICGAAGATVEAVEPWTLAYARALLKCAGAAWRGRDVIVAMLGSRNLTVCLFCQGSLDFVRIRDLPADTNTPGLLCVWLAAELRAVIHYCDSQTSRVNRDCQVRVVLHDGKHTAGELAPLLAAEAGTRSFTVVDACEPVALCPVPQENRSGQRASRAAVGAALRLLDAPGDDLRINLLPKTVTEARSFARDLLVTANVGVVVFLGIFVAGQLLMRTTGAVDRKIDQSRLSQQTYAARALITEEKFLDREILGLRQSLTPLRKAVRLKPEAHWPSVLEVVRQATPAGVSVTQLQCADGMTLSLKGVASSRDAAQLFERNLEGREPFASVSLMHIHRQQSDPDRLEYQIDCLVKAKGGTPS